MDGFYTKITPKSDRLLAYRWRWSTVGEIGLDFRDGGPDDDEIREAVERSVVGWVAKESVGIKQYSEDWTCLIRQCRAERDDGLDPDDGPLMLRKPAPEDGRDRTLSQAFEKYIQENSSEVSARTLQEWETAVARFVSVHGNKPVDEVTRGDIDGFRQCLLKMPRRPKNTIRTLSVADQVAWAEQQQYPRLAPGTVAKNITAIKVVLDFAFRQTAMISGSARLSWRNPCEGFVKRSKKQINARRPFKDEHVCAIFNPETYNTTRPSRFWIPLMLNYTGARLNEIGQLLLSDFHAGKVAYVRLQAELDDEEIDLNATKNIKSEAGIRSVPLHDDLIRIGILEYIDRVRCSGHAHLFPDLPHERGSRRTKQISNWFGRYRKVLGLDPNRYVLHSFRHAFRTRAQRAEGVWEPMVRMVQGHSLGNDVASAVYGQHDRNEPFTLKRQVIDKLPFPELQFVELAKIAKGLKV